MRWLTEEQKAMLRSDGLCLNVLVTFYLDEGTYRFCDDVEDLSDAQNTWIGASALIGTSEIKGSSPLAAEGVTLIADGTRMHDAGIADPAFVLRALFQAKFHQRRVDIDFAFRYNDSQTIQLIVPMYAGKINYAKLIDEAGTFIQEATAQSKLEIQLDSLAMRYQRTSYRTRSHEDHLQLTNNADDFFIYVSNAGPTESNIYWGKEAPKNLTQQQADAERTRQLLLRYITHGAFGR